MRLRRFLLMGGLAALLAACGGGAGPGLGSPLAGDVAAQSPPSVRAPGAHRVMLPVDADVVNIEILDEPDLDQPDIPLQVSQPFAATVESRRDDQMLLLRVRKRDAAAMASGMQIETGDGAPGSTVAKLLVSGRLLNEMAVTVSPITDYISRRLRGYTESQTPERLRYFQDTLSAALIARDLTGDGVVDYRDALAFEPDNRRHLAALNFDYPALVNAPLDSGLSLLQTYTQKPADVGDALDAVFDPLESVALPLLAQSVATIAQLNIDTDYGGSVRIDEVPGMVLTAQNPRWVRRVPLAGTPEVLTLHATADEGMRFVRWVDCPQLQGDGSCRVIGDQDRFVGAQFGLAQETLTDGVLGVLKLARHTRGDYETSLGDDGELTIHNLAGNPTLADALAQVAPGWMVATGNWRYPFRRVMAVTGAVVAGDPGLPLQLQTEPAEIYDVYQAMSDFETGEQPTLDEIQVVRVSLDDTGEPALSLLPAPVTPSSAEASTQTSEASQTPQTQRAGVATASTFSAASLQRSAAAGSTASAARTAPRNLGPLKQAESERVWIAGRGQALDAGEGYYLVNNPAGGFELIRAEGEVQTLQGAPATLALRSACDANPLGTDCGQLAVQSSGVQSLMRSAAVQPTALVASAAATQVQARASSSFSFPLGEVTLSNPNYPVLVGKFKASATLEFESLSGSMTLQWSAVPPGVSLDANARGNIKVTLNAEAFIGLQGKTDFAASLSTKACGNGKEASVKKPEGSPQTLAERAVNPVFGDGGDLVPGIDSLDLSDLDVAPVNFCNPKSSPSGSAGTVDVLNRNRLRVAVQLNPGWLGGAVAPLRFGVGLQATAKGQIGMKADLTTRYVFPYDVDVSIGSNCSRGLFGRTTCPVWDLKKPQRIEGRFGSYRNTRFSLGLTMNAEFSPGVDASFTWGPRGLNEELLQAGATASLPLRVVGTLGMWKTSDFPEDVAAKIPAECSNPFNYALGLGWKLELYATINPEISIGSWVKFGLKEVELAHWEKSGDILPPRIFKGSKSLMPGFDMDACLPLKDRPARFFAASQKWKAGELRWDQPMMAITRNRKLMLQEDGNLVLYALNRGANGTGGIDSEKVLWSSDTYGRAGARVAFQPDGNLVAYDLFERPIFASGTWQRGSAMELRQDGALVITDSGGRELWRASGS